MGDATKLQEDRVRQLATEAGYMLRKSRLRGHAKPDDQGQYMLLEAQRNIAVLGSRFDATLAEVETWLRE